MKIAVTFENGQVFQHFGHTEQFKLYEVEGGKVVASEVIDTNGSGHEALADFLAQRGVGALVCGGIGDGAQAALSASGIEICSGAQGDADEAVAAAAAVAVIPLPLSKVPMWARSARPTIAAPSTTVPCSTPPMTVASPWSSSAAWV